MKYSLLYLLSLFFVIQIQAQDKVEVVQQSRTSFLKTLNLGDNGIFIKTGKDNLNSKNVDWQIKYYSADLELIWDATIEKDQINKGFANPMVASPNGSFFYQFEYQGYNTTFGAKKINATQINRLGTKKNVLLKDEEFLFESEVTFCNDEYLYFLEREGDSGSRKKAMLNDKIVFHTYSHEDFSYTKYELDLPAIKDIDNSSFWHYMGHGNDIIYLSYRTFNKKEEKIYFYVVAVDKTGNILNDFRIDASLKNMNIRAAQPNRTYAYNMARMPSTWEVMKYGDIVVDVPNESIFIYGLTGEKPPKRAGSKYEGYFIQKYNLQGQKEWKVQRRVSEQLAKEGFFKIHGKESDRSIALTLTPDGGAKFQIFFKDQIHTYKFDSEGEKTRAYVNEIQVISTHGGQSVDCGVLNLSFTPKERSNVFAYFLSLDKTKAKSNLYRYYRSSEGEILIENDPKSDKYSIMFFKL